MKFQGLVTDGNLLRFDSNKSNGVFVMAYRNHYFDLQHFKSFQILVAQAKREGGGSFSSLHVINNVRDI